jgi:hypothetical protein
MLRIGTATGIAALLAVSFLLGGWGRSAAPVDGQTPALDDRVRQLETRLTTIEGRLAALERSRQSTSSSVTASPAAASAAATPAATAYSRGVKVALDFFTGCLDQVRQQNQVIILNPADPDADSGLAAAQGLRQSCTATLARELEDLSPPACYQAAHAALLQAAKQLNEAFTDEARAQLDEAIAALEAVRC